MPMANHGTRRFAWRRTASKSFSFSLIRPREAPLSRSISHRPKSRTAHSKRRSKTRNSRIGSRNGRNVFRSEEHTSELQSQSNLVCRLLLEKKKSKKKND